MKRVCLLACCAVLGGCMHSAPGEVKKEPSTMAAKQEKPELSASIVEKTIIKGKTTKKEILATLGPPNSIDPNTRLLPKEVLAKATAPLPPIATTVEFWNYWTVADAAAVNPAGRKAAQPSTTQVFRVTIFFDEHDVAVDYLTSERQVVKPQE